MARPGLETVVSGRVQRPLSIRFVRAAVATAHLRGRVAASENSGGGIEMAQTAQLRRIDSIENEAQRVFALQREAYLAVGSMNGLFAQVAG